MKMTRTRIRMKRILSRVSLLLLLVSPLSLGAETIKFALRPGNVYEYKLTASQSNESRALVSSFNSSGKNNETSFSLNVIDFQEDAFIVDISNGGQVFRRYIREDGSISGAPGEAGQQIPFFMSFPAGDWQPGQRHQLKKPIRLGRQSFTANWQMLLKSVDKEKNLAEILFNCVPELPASRLARRNFTLKGRMIFDLTQGTVNRAEWITEYNFQLHNKEVAISRNLWALKQKASYSLQLVNILEQ